MKGAGQRNLVREDVKIIRRLYEAGSKNADDILKDLLGVFEQIFVGMRENPYLAESFNHTMTLSRKVIEKTGGDVESYERDVKRLARKYGVNYIELMSQAELFQSQQNTSELEEAVDDKENELARKAMEKGKIRTKMCSVGNEMQRAKNLLHMLRREYMAGGVESERFREIYEPYCKEVRLLELKKLDVSEYPINIEKLKDRFSQSSKDAPIDYTRPNAQANSALL